MPRKVIRCIPVCVLLGLFFTPAVAQLVGQSSSLIRVLPREDYTLAAPVSYVLEVKVTGTGVTSPSEGTYTVSAGVNFNITAIANPHYYFDHWLLDGKTNGTDNPSKVFMDGNHTFTAVFTAYPNSPPVLSVPGPQTTIEGGRLTFTVNATDTDFPTETVSLSAAGLPRGSTFDPASGAYTNGNPAGGTFSWTPTEAQGPADYLITFHATDNGAGTLSDTKPVLIHVNEANLPPMFQLPAQMSANLQGSVSFTVNASDPDIPGENLTITAVVLPPGANFFPSSRVFSWTPTKGYGPGNYTAAFRVSDGSLSTTQSMIITVTQSVQPPSLSVPTISQPIDPDTPIVFTVIATSANIPPTPVTLSSSGLPPGAVFDASTGTFSWTPTNSQGPGVYIIAFTADNGAGQSTTHRVTITVKASSQFSPSLTPLNALTDPLWYVPIVLIVPAYLAIVLLWVRRTRESKETQEVQGPEQGTR